jgi:hypothetical protein
MIKVGLDYELLILFLPEFILLAGTSTASNILGFRKVCIPGGGYKLPMIFTLWGIIP